MASHEKMVGDMDLTVERISTETGSSMTDPFQSFWWGEVKRSLGWVPLHFKIHDRRNDSPLGEVMVLQRNLLRWICSIGYIHGDLAACTCSHSERVHFLEELSNALEPHLSHSTIFIRYDLTWEKEICDDPWSQSSRRLKQLPYAIQPEATVLIDLTLDEEALRAGLRTRTRRNLIRSGSTTHIRSFEHDTRAFDSWYDIYLETARRDGFAPRSKEHLLRILEVGERQEMSVQEQPETDLLIAYEDVSMKMTGGIITLRTSDRCIYLYGASLRTIGYSSSYSLIWQAMMKAKRAGCVFFDLYGISGGGSGSAHLKGLDLFKTGFGGRVVQYIGTCDYVLRPVRYRIYRFLEFVRIRKARRSTLSSRTGSLKIQ